MRTLINTIIAMAVTTTAFAANGAPTEGLGFFAWVFIGLCAAVLVGQLVPAVLLLIGVVKGLVKNPEKAKNH